MIGPIERILLHLAALVTLASGTGLFLAKRVLTHDDPFANVGSPWEPVLLSVHVLAAPVLLFLIGVILRRHVLARLREPRPAGRRSGGLLTALLAPLVLSGYLLQVVTVDALRVALAWIHGGTGLIFALAYLAHARRRGALAARAAAELWSGEGRDRALTGLATAYNNQFATAGSSRGRGGREQPRQAPPPPKTSRSGRRSSPS